MSASVRLHPDHARPIQPCHRPDAGQSSDTIRRPVRQERSSLRLKCGHETRFDRREEKEGSLVALKPAVGPGGDHRRHPPLHRQLHRRSLPGTAVKRLALGSFGSATRQRHRSGGVWRLLLTKLFTGRGHRAVQRAAAGPQSRTRLAPKAPHSTNLVGFRDVEATGSNLEPPTKNPSRLVPVARLNVMGPLNWCRRIDGMVLGRDRGLPAGDRG